MTLATRCPSCGTVFRVVQDQLRVSQGWVRCGRCSEAFNAQEAMVDWPAAEAQQAGEAAAALTSERVPAADEVVIALPPEPGPPLIELPPGVEVIASDGAMSVDLAEPALAAAPAIDSPPMTPETIAPPAPAFAPPEAPAAAAIEPRPAAPPDAALDEPLQPPPSFVLRAERAARWRRPGVRLALSAAALGAALGLAAQGVYVFRDRIAAGQPAWRPALQQVCAALGCRVGEYRQIDALSVESTALTRVDGAPVYRLAVSLRNRAALEVAAPAIDLSLTDAQGRPIARRVLQMSDLGLPLRTLKAGSEVPIQASLAVGDRPVSGYAVEIFYP